MYKIKKTWMFLVFRCLKTILFLMGVRGAYLFSFMCCVFRPVSCVPNVASVSLDYSFLIALSVFSNVYYLNFISIKEEFEYEYYVSTFLYIEGGLWCWTPLFNNTSVISFCIYNTVVVTNIIIHVSPKNIDASPKIVRK